MTTNQFNLRDGSEADFRSSATRRPGEITFPSGGDRRPASLLYSSALHIDGLDLIKMRQDPFNLLIASTQMCPKFEMFQNIHEGMRLFSLNAHHCALFSRERRGS